MRIQDVHEKPAQSLMHHKFATSYQVTGFHENVQVLTATVWNSGQPIATLIKSQWSCSSQYSRLVLDVLTLWYRVPKVNYLPDHLSTNQLFQSTEFYLQSILRCQSVRG